MPFAQIYWNPASIAESEIVSYRDRLVSIAATVLTRFDSEHLVTASMFDCRVTEQGRLDLFRARVFVTVLARFEPNRRTFRAEIVDAISKELEGTAGITDAVIELVLTEHTSSFDYTALEAL